jgi:hypothetical protein
MTMTNNFYKKLVSSFHDYEKKDYNAVCNIISEKFGYWDNLNVALISDDPYLILLIFTALIRYYGITIHIINPAESIDEINRLLLSIDDLSWVIVAKKDFRGLTYKSHQIVINGMTINEASLTPSTTPQEIDFTVVTYTTYPTKINRIAGETFIAMINALNNDLGMYNLCRRDEYGLIPFVTDNIDYLLYFIAFKLNKYCNNTDRLLPTQDEIKYVIKERKHFMEHNCAKTLFIPKKEFIELWDKRVQSVFENRRIFKCSLKHNWFVNFLIRRRLKKLLKGFSKVLVIGYLESSYMVNILKNLSFVKFYNILPVKTALFFGSISQDFDRIESTTNVEFKPHPPNATKDQIYLCIHRIRNEENGTIINIPNTSARFIKKMVEGTFHYEDRFCYIGDINNAFEYHDKYVFPETLEKVINSYPFIKESVLLTFKGKLILIINPNQGVLDANRINYGMFKRIIQRQIATLNKELPDAYRIRGFDIGSSLIDKDRDGEIVRYIYTYLNKRSGL